MPREVICFSLRQKDVPEKLVDGVMSLYNGYKTAVSIDRELSTSFSLKVGVHQGSALSPFLFIMVMDVLTEDVRDVRRCELILCGELLNKTMSKYGRWKNAVERTRQRVNVHKTKGMLLLFEKKSSVSSVDSCGVCGVILLSV